MKTQKQLITPIGEWTGSRKESGLVLFSGIPYAKPPTGKLRWQPPQPILKNDKKYNRQVVTSIPIQNNVQGLGLAEASIYMSEDCLHLNIWTMDNEMVNKPVLFWLYGGSYIGGYNQLEENDCCEFVINNPDIIVVAPNYRLGLLASLNLSSIDRHGEYRKSNNLALLDQQLAMKWVHDYIAFFGGDPDNVTLFGHSAGSNAISHHLAIASSRKYFKNAICQSSFFPDLGYTSLEKSRQIGEEVIKRSGCKTIESLLSIHPMKLLTIQQEILGMTFEGKSSKFFSPVADGIVLPYDPLGEILKGTIAGVNLMIGTSNGEYDQMFHLLDEGQSKELLLRLNAGKFTSNLELVDEYCDINKASTCKENYMDMQADLYLRVPGLILAKASAPFTNVYVYYYQFDEDQERGRAGHGAANALIFGSKNMSEREKKMSQKLMASWATFIRRGNPNNPKIPTWPQYEYLSNVTMVMDEEWKLHRFFRESQYKLLEDSFPEAIRVRARYELGGIK